MRFVEDQLAQCSQFELVHCYFFHFDYLAELFSSPELPKLLGEIELCKVNVLVLHDHVWLRLVFTVQEALNPINEVDPASFAAFDLVVRLLIWHLEVVLGHSSGKRLHGLDF